MLKHKILAALAGLMLVTGAYGAAWAGNVPAKHQGEGRVYDAQGFSIVPPPGWQSLPPTHGNFMSYADQAKDGFRVNFNVNVKNDDAPATEKLGPLVKQFLGQSFASLNWQLGGEGYLTIDKQKTYWISSKLVQNSMKFQNVQYLIRGNKKIYFLTFTSLAKDFKKFEELFNKHAMTARTD